nr:TonB-dependent receptor [uncultured Undibacterium sp.]
MKQFGRSAMAIAIGMCFTSIAQAQVEAATASTQRIEITGSRIRQVDLETAQPVLKMSQEQIQKSGLVTVGDILNTLSSAGNPAFSKGAVLTSNREQGGQYIDMRNLGAERLLVLVNGKRWTQSIDGFTDMSTIPSSMIDRIEILKDGASSIYGSDAIAGVVNIILKKKLDGGQMSAYVGQNSKGDGKTEDYSLSFGAGNDKASMMFGLSHSKQGTVWARDREITSYTYGPDHPYDGLGTGAFGRIREVNALGNATGFNKYLNHTGSFEEPGVGQSSRNPASYHDFANSNDDKYNSTRSMMFQSPTELTSIFTKGTLELPADIRFTTTAMYAQRSSSAQVAGYPLNSLSQIGFPVYISKDSYFNPYGNQVAGAGNGKDLFFYRRTTEVPRVTTNKNKTLHIDATLEGELTIANMPWNWSAGFNHSSVTGMTINTGNINLFNLKKAVGPSFKNSLGVIQCGTPDAPVANCVPFDLLGGPSASTPEALNYVMHTGGGSYSSSVNSATVDVSGEIFKLPAGAVGIAAGLEHRKVSGDDTPNALEQMALTTNLAAFTTKGDYTVKEGYLELNVPILKSLPFAQLLSMNFASRHSDYSNFGKTTNSKASFMWKPINDLLTRGTYAEGFRAPALGDTFGGGSQSFDSYLDICDSKFGEASRNPLVAARCAADGVPAGFRQKNQGGTAVTAGGAQTTVAFNTGVGNNTLTPETATTKTLGFVYNPSFVPGLTVSVDWFNIEVKNRVSAIGVGYTLNQCYVLGVQSFCDNFSRDPSSGVITQLSRGNKNMGTMSTEGFDLGINYRFPKTAYGQFAVRTETTYLDSYSTQSTNEAEKLNYAGEYPYYRVKSNLAIDWSRGNWSATFGTRYMSPAKGNCWDADPEAPIECNNPTGITNSFGTGYDLKGSQIYNDISVGYATPWKGKVMVGINNVFARKPRTNYDTSSSSTSVDPDVPLDRFFYVRYNQSF